MELIIKPPVFDIANKIWEVSINKNENFLFIKVFGKTMEDVEREANLIKDAYDKEISFRDNNYF